MRIAAYAIIATTSVVGPFGSAIAADMTGAEITAFLSGKTAYLEMPSGVAGHVIYWGEDGTALYKSPSGAIMHGKWEIKDNTICSNWQENPGMWCVRYDKTGDVVTIIDVSTRSRDSTGRTRGKIVKTAPGNAEKLTP